MGCWPLGLRWRRFDTSARGMDYIIDRLKERSTYTGLAALLGAFGLAIDPETFSAAVAAVIALVGLWEVFRKENK